jgi:ABC-type polysaccharide/polyol phosphate export permease
VKPNGKNIELTIKRLLLTIIQKNQNTMFLTCFLIHLVLVLRTSLGYIASDMYSRYKDINNVLHLWVDDSFWLPAEQYAIQTGQRPGILLV